MRSRKDNPKAEQARVRFCIVAIGLRNWATSMVRRVKGGEGGSNDICSSYKGVGWESGEWRNNPNMVADGEIILHPQGVESSKER